MRILYIFMLLLCNTLLITISTEIDIQSNVNQTVADKDRKNPVDFNEKHVDVDGEDFFVDDLIDAAANNDIDAVHQLLHDGHDPNSINDAGWTSLIFATDHENIELVEILLNGGAGLLHYLNYFNI